MQALEEHADGELHHAADQPEGLDPVAEAAADTRADGCEGQKQQRRQPERAGGIARPAQSEPSQERKDQISEPLRTDRPGRDVPGKAIRGAPILHQQQAQQEVIRSIAFADPAGGREQADRDRIGNKGNQHHQVQRIDATQPEQKETAHLAGIQPGKLRTIIQRNDEAAEHEE
ncbi:hypothetical protein GCM10011504_03570 [Siccirubricoccus deserti]|nr:hypothetical protein GCM10011504_03570 [Siccirubricoccus deserti]